jgi:hypothetical protein
MAQQLANLEMSAEVLSLVGGSLSVQSTVLLRAANLAPPRPAHDTKSPFARTSNPWLGGCRNTSNENNNVHLNHHTAFHLNFSHHVED